LGVRVPPSALTADPDDLALELLEALAARGTVAAISGRVEGFGVEEGYRVLAAIGAARAARGWVPVGRKIGFTNRAVWELFGVEAPIWAPVWDRTCTAAPDGAATLALDELVQPRLECEVAFGLAGPVPPSGDAEEVLAAVEWFAPAFEVVQCVFDGWRFALPDAVAAFGLHARLVVGPRVPVGAGDRAALAARLATFEATLSRDGEVVTRGTGSDVLDSPALALGQLAALLAARPGDPPLAAGEVVTTGTITNPVPLAAGEVWSVDVGALGLPPLELRVE
jgi:2-oxo-3-hexenedioate decarboxylase